MKYSTFLLLVAALPLSSQNYAPLTAEERVKWFGATTYGPRSLLISGPISAGWRTYRNRPEEWEPHWDGFGKRYAARLLDNTVTNGLEASMGAIWKEDPRYFRIGQGPMRRRIGRTVRQTFMNRYGDGSYHVGAAKAIGIVGTSYARKLWMPDSVTSNRDCAYRIGGGYAGRFIGNFFREFGPDLLKKMKISKN